MGRSGFSTRIPAKGAGAALLVVALCVAFVVLRYAVDSRAALIASQVVYLLGPAGAAAFTFAAGRVSPSGSRPRALWWLMSFSTGVLTISEALYAVNTVMGRSGGVYALAADGFNLVGMIAFALFLGVIVQISSFGTRRMVQSLLDALLVLVLSFALIYRFGISLLPDAVAQTEIAVAVRHAVYASVGVAMTVGVVYCIFGLRGRGRSSETILFAGLLTFSAAVVLWPIWSIASQGGSTFPGAEQAINVLYLLGYTLVGVAAYSRLLSVDGPWELSVSMQRPRLIWPGALSATIVLGGVSVLTWSVVTPRHVVPDQAVYLVGASLVAACMVGRTALTSIELDEVRASSVTDMLTGALNARGLKERLDALLDANRRFSETFAVAIVDVDDLDRVNQTLGSAVGDAVLTELAAVFSEEAGHENVFRLAGDEFAVLFPHLDSTGAGAHARRLVERVAERRPAGVAVTVSVGFAQCSSRCDSSELLARAEHAQQWAKRHGKNRVVRFEDEALQLAEMGAPLAALPVGPSLDIARALCAAADARDPANYHHSRSVGALSILLARACGVDADRVRRIEVAAILHDVGKIALPDAMLGGRTLPFRQRPRAEEHAALGARLVEALDLPGVSSWVRAHHERWDGRGYPDGLKGEAIPLEARIISLADAYDGMTTGKRYGAPMSKAAALQEIDLGIGVRFDPQLAELFIRVVGATGALGWSDEWPAT